MKTIIRKVLLPAICIAAMLMAGCSGSSVSSGSNANDYSYDDLSKYIKLGEYKGIEYTKIDTNVSDKEVEEKIDEILSEKTETVKIESGKVKKNSIANIDYTGSIDGVEFDGGAAEGYDLDIANSTFIDGFAEALVGHEVGETFDIDVTFPEDYHNEDLAGKPAVFKITVNYLSEKKTPEYSDEWVKENTDFTSKKEYEKSIREDLEAQKAESARSTEQREVFGKIEEASEVIEYPEKEYNERHDQIVQSYEELAKNSGTDLESYLSTNMGMDTETFNEEVKSAAESTVKTELILHSIARNEGIEFTDDDYNSFKEDVLEAAGFTRDSFKEQSGMDFDEYAVQNNLYLSYIYERVMAKVMEYSKAV